MGLSKTASDKEIARAYRKLAKQFHPDAHPGSEERFKEVNAAYEVLGDQAKRKEYDEVRTMSQQGFAGNPFAGCGCSCRRGRRVFELPGGRPGRSSRQYFWQSWAPGAVSSGAVGPRGDDIDAELHLSFEEAVKGATTTVNVISEAPCSTCGGSGAAPGTAPRVCPVCGGSGVINENQGMFSFSHPCTACGGTGMQIEVPCPTCAGRGTERRARQVKVRIPPGVEDGQRIRVPGRGGAGRYGGPAGDLYVVVHIAAHPVFGQKGKDLTVKVPITFAEAALGTTVAVPTLNSKPVNVKVPAGTRSGRSSGSPGMVSPRPASQATCS